MSKYNIVSQRDDNGQAWAVTRKGDQIVVLPIEAKGNSDQQWEVKFQQGKSRAGIALVSGGQAISYTANNTALGTVPFEPVSKNDNSIWLIDPNDSYPFFLVVNPEHTWGQIWDIHGGGAYNDAPLYTWNQNGGANQRWKFVEVA